MTIFRTLVVALTSLWRGAVVSAPTEKKGPTRIHVLVIDDEPLARARMRTLIADHPDIEIVGECGNGAEAILAIEKHSSDRWLRGSGRSISPTCGSSPSMSLRSSAGIGMPRSSSIR